MSVIARLSMTTAEACRLNILFLTRTATTMRLPNTARNAMTQNITRREIQGVLLWVVDGSVLVVLLNAVVIVLF